MRRLLAAMLCVVSWACFGQGVSLDLNQVALRDLVRLVYGEVLHASYVVDLGSGDDLRPVSLVVKSATSDQLESLVVDLLKSQGVDVVKRGGVVWVRRAEDKSRSEELELVVYRPKFRTVQYFQNLLAGLFPPGAFAGQRSGSGVPFASVSGDALGLMRANPSTGQSAAIAGTLAQQGVNRQADVDLDCLIVSVSKSDALRLRGLLETLDVPQGEVNVKAVVYEVRTGKSDGSGLDLALSVLNSKLALSFSSPSSITSALTAKFVNGANSVQAVFKALSSDDRFRSVSSPRLRVRSGSAAKLVVGDETPVLGSVSYDGNNRPVQSVNYKSSGVIFGLKPVVRSSSIDLHVTQEISSFIATTNGVSGSPTLIKRELETDLTLQSGDLVVIGGLELDSESRQVSGLPFLPGFMRSNSADDSRSEIVLFLHVERLE